MKSLKPIINEFMFTKDTWHTYTDDHANTGFLDYIDATEDFIKVLDVITNNDSLEEMKINLDKLIKNRRKFVKFANNHLP